ncbi:hypothetical protein KO500_02745 [Cellulophaga baltica]|uniref:hypothetical protein n=1 Tax=Cellulophaga TaxID=104264 RepID=UPI001C07677A|nr:MULTISPECIES: hypothetical protein [Cellulophaga]MBU2995329.1 hypothetical protein [Cellulophaga baltica]MDO6766724.1 hypothetical protein [Cellulophaga sp. 1_MG-2023]
MNIFKKLFGFKELNENSETIKSELSKIKSEFLKLQTSLKTVSDNNKIHQEENRKIESELLKMTQLLKPKKSIPTEFKIIDPLTKDSIFSFQKLAKTNSQVTNKKLLENKPNRILQAIGNIPEFISGGLLSQSYLFNFPKGVTGNIMNIANGQGTAIMSGGKILAHGSYVSNLIVSAPLLAYSAGNMIIKQHYLAKINFNLKEINERLETLIDLEFIKKEAKIEAMIVFYKKAFSQFDLISENENYKNAILSNIIAKNIEVYELIHFYKNSIEKIKKDEEGSFQKSIQYFLSLQELFVFGKILEFKYANEFNKAIVNDLTDEFNEMQKDYFDFFKKHEGELHNLGNSINTKWFDKWYFFRNSKKNKTIEKKERVNSNRNFVNELRIENELIFDQNSTLLNDFLKNIEKPQEFLIENGELYTMELENTVTNTVYN